MNITKEQVVASLNMLKYKILGTWIVRHLSSNRYIYFTLVCIAIPIIIYWRHFGANGLSNSTDNWGTFGDYIGGCCSLILALIALVITRKMDRKERRDKKREEAAEEINRRFGLNVSVELNPLLTKVAEPEGPQGLASQTDDEEGDVE